MASSEGSNNGEEATVQDEIDIMKKQIDVGQ